MGTKLLLLNVQTDDMDLAASRRIATMLAIQPIAGITVALQSRTSTHIIHPLFWSNADGIPPPPHTVISGSDLENGTWFPSNPAHNTWAQSYLCALKNQKRVHTICAPSGIPNTVGHTICPTIKDMLRLHDVCYVPQNIDERTEMSSCFSAAVCTETTMFNQRLLADLLASTYLLICGSNVCASVLDRLNNVSYMDANKIYLVSDLISSGIGEDTTGFMHCATCLGARVVSSDQLHLLL